MKPIELARKQYDKDSPRTFEEDLVFYLNKGTVYSSGDCFIMGRPINRRHSRFCLDYKFTYRPKEWDTWFVYLAVGPGNVHRFQEVAPFPLEWVGWNKHKGDNPNILNFYKWDKFKRKVTKNG